MSWYLLKVSLNNKKMDKIILEILVDKNNEKSSPVFENILVIIHNVFEDFRKKKAFKKQQILSNFSFEITKIWNRIRFFIVSPKKYKNFLINQIYAQYTDVEINEVWDYLANIPNDKIKVWSIFLKKHELYPIADFVNLSAWKKEEIDPYSAITSALWRTWLYTLNSISINFSPIPNSSWKENTGKIITILESQTPDFIKNILLDKRFIYLKMILAPFIYLFKVISFIIDKSFSLNEAEESSETEENKNPEQKTTIFADKLSKLGFSTSISIIHAWEDEIDAKTSIKEIFSTLSVFARNPWNSFVLKEFLDWKNDDISFIKDRLLNNSFILNSSELSWLVHLPTSWVKTPQINWVCSRAFEPPSNLQIVDPNLSDDIVPESDLTPLWKTNFRWTNMSFGIWPSDRRRHIYIIWKTWMGKSTLLENMIIDDIKKGRWVAVIDPHGDLAEAVIGHIPKSRTNSAIIFDPSDTEWPIAFNMLDWVSVEHRPLVASGLVWIFKKIFWDSWGPRLEHILRNTILALLEYPNTTLISIPLMLTSDVYREKVVAKITDPIVKKFWVSEFAKMAPNQKTEAAGPILNKVWQFLSSTILRNILWQSKNTFNMRWAMDNGKIIIINLSKGKIWEDASALLWAMMVTKFQMDAMSRADIAEKDRKDFYLYVDEFQNFATDSFATILSEARKYKLNLVMANQYIDQMQETVKWAVFWNVGSIISFQVWHSDASIMKEAFWNNISPDDLTNLKKYNIYLKQLIDGMPSPVFSASTFAPHKKNDEIFEVRYKKILSVSREKYSKNRKVVEWYINKSLFDLELQENQAEKRKAEYDTKKKEEKAKKNEERIKK